MHSEYIIKKQSKNDTIRALPSAVIYGANASGKSNVILAMYILKKIVTLGTLDTKELEAYLNVIPFIHNENYYKPTTLEITFFQKENVYKYRLSFLTKFNEHNIIEEHLSINTDEIFTRTSANGVYMPIRNLIRKGHIQADDIDEAFYKTLIQKLNKTLDPQQLFLFSGIKNLINNDYYTDIQEWFTKFLVVMNANDVSFNQRDLKRIDKNIHKSNSLSKNDFYESNNITDILDCAEFGKQQIQFLSDIDRDDLAMVSLYDIPNPISSIKDVKIIVNSELMESKGTIQLIRFIQPFIDTLKMGGIIVLDEMDASLHFEIVVSLLRIFNNAEINKTGAQLIFNTHNPIYLDGTLLRHDQILMVSKDKESLTSELYAISDYNLRPEERILKNYLDGKYGALPHMDLEIAFMRILEREGI